jgi:hypothetical protein
VSFDSMLRRREINSEAGAPRLRATVAAATGPVRDVALAVEERLVWPGADALKGIFDAVRWPFERLAWVVEQRLVWPLQERSGEWSAPRRAAVAAAALAAVGAGAASLLLLGSGGGGHATAARSVAVRVAPPAPQPQPASPAAPILHGAPPVFAPAPKGGVQAPLPKTKAAHGAAAATPAKGASAAASAAPGEVAGPAAITAARHFSAAFVLYETGQAGPGVRSAFHTTATPKLAASLLHRPPRLPANVDVPRAKVLNVAPGPQLGDDCTVSVSLLRVGLTSELRLSMHRKKNGPWLVKGVLG